MVIGNRTSVDIIKTVILNCLMTRSWLLKVKSVIRWCGIWSMMKFIVCYFLVPLESQIIYVYIYIYNVNLQGELIGASSMQIACKMAKLFTCLGSSTQSIVIWLQLYSLLFSIPVSSDRGTSHLFWIVIMSSLMFTVLTISNTKRSFSQTEQLLFILPFLIHFECSSTSISLYANCKHSMLKLV